MGRKYGKSGRKCCEVGHCGVICVLWKTTERDFETHSKRNQISLKTQHGKEHVAATADTEGTSELPQHGVDLNGEFHFKVDGKGRMALPAKFRKVLSKDLVVTPELTNECVYVFETPDFNEWVEKLFIDRFGEYKESDREHVKLRRVLKSRARDVEVDASGRIMLSPEVRAAVGIDKEVVVVGNTGRFEIWDADRFKAMSDEVDLGLFYS